MPWLIGGLVILVAAGGIDITQGTDVAVSRVRSQLVTRLKHRESLLQSVAASFSVEYSVTNPESIPLIREVCANRGNEADYPHFVTSGEMARQMSYRARWFRRGIKEREEQFPLDGDHEARPRQIKAFDGLFVRHLNVDQMSARFDTLESAAWNRSSRLNLLSIFAEFMGRNYSDIVESGRNFGSAETQIGSTSVNQILVSHPESEGLSFRLYFDKDGLMVRRETLALGYSSDPQLPLMYERVDISDYRSYDDGSGESAMLPHLAVLHRYVGALPSGQPVDYGTITLTVESIKLNTPISEDTFVVAFPAAAKVWDEVNGLGWTGGAALPERQIGRTVSIYWLVPAAVVLLLLIVRRVRRARMVQPSAAA